MFLGSSPLGGLAPLDFDGAWLFNYGIGIHLLQCQDPEEMPKINQINPNDNHKSFQCESMATVENMLEEMEIECLRSRVEEGVVNVDQLFFHDPDGTMIEICNCDNLPVIPLVENRSGAAHVPITMLTRINSSSSSCSLQVITCLPSVHVKEDLPSLYINRANLAN